MANVLKNGQRVASMTRVIFSRDGRWRPLATKYYYVYTNSSDMCLESLSLEAIITTILLLT